MLKKAALAFAGMVVVLAGIAASAGATDTFSFSPSGRIGLASVGALTFAGVGGGLSASCNVTLTGTLASRADKLSGTTIGGITAGSGSCGSGSVAFPGLRAEAPWPIVYNSIQGTLPTAVSGIQLELSGATVAVTLSFVTCTYRGEMQGLLAVTGGASYSGQTIASEANDLANTSGFLCPRLGEVIGSLAFSARQTVTPTFAGASPLTTSPDILEFGPVAAGTTAEVDVRYTNRGEVDLVLGVPTTHGIDADAFDISDIDCANETLLENESCRIMVIFDSTGHDGDRRAANLRMPYTPAGGVAATHHVNVRGKVR